MPQQKPILSVTDAGFRRQADKLAKQYGLRAKDIMIKQMGLWGTDLAKRMYPKRKDARIAIEHDLNRAFIVLKNYSNDNLISDADVAVHHKETRDRRTGRVKWNYGRSGSGKRKFISQRKMNKYRRVAQAKIGTVHAGWIPMIKYYGGKMPPKWIAQHASKAKGRAIDRMKAKGTGFLVGINSVGYASRMIKDVLSFTANRRRRDLIKQMKEGIRLESGKFNRAKT